MPDNVLTNRNHFARHQKESHTLFSNKNSMHSDQNFTVYSDGTIRFDDDPKMVLAADEFDKICWCENTPHRLIFKSPQYNLGVSETHG